MRQKRRRAPSHRRDAALRKADYSSKRNPDPQWLDELLQSCGVKLFPDQIALLWRYHQILRQANLDRDLTRITGFESMVVKHYVDCLLVLQKCILPQRLVDLGSGAGFPGIPLKIGSPETNIILAEPRPRRVAFLKDVCRDLKLKDIGIFPHKVTSRSFSLPIDGIITRAVEDISKTLTRSQEILASGGKVIFMKGPAVNRELEELKSFPALNELFNLKEDITYELPRLNHGRRLVIFEKR